eukprot:226278-Pleurochrysis_carterae.AAC.1
MVDSTAVESNWGRVFYTNLWASVLSGALLVSTEPHVFTQTIWTPHSICALAASCTLGVGISYFAFLCRAAVSATCFTVIGAAAPTRQHAASHAAACTLPAVSCRESPFSTMSTAPALSTSRSTSAFDRRKPSPSPHWGAHKHSATTSPPLSLSRA